MSTKFNDIFNKTSVKFIAGFVLIILVVLLALVITNGYIEDQQNERAQNYLQSN